MKLKWISLTLAATILAYPMVYAENAPDQPVQASKSSIAFNQMFNFNWNDDRTIEPARQQLSSVEDKLKDIDISTLNTENKIAFGKLLYRLGSFYTHIERKPNLAIAKLDQADTLLADPQDKTWNYNHLAYAFEQRFAASNQAIDKEKSLFYANKVIAEYKNKDNQETAFAYCVKGLVYNDAKNYHDAEESYKKALAVYEKMPHGKDDQYIRAKNRLADIISDQGRHEEALSILKDLKKYWLSKKDLSHNPYAARNLISLGQIYLKMNKTTAAQQELDHAIKIYRNIYGANSEQLAKPYQLLATTYDKQGKHQLAVAYLNKANKAKGI